MIKSSSVSHENFRKNLDEDKISKKDLSIESSGDSDISKESFVSFEVKKKQSLCRDEESNDSLSSSREIKKILISKCKPVKLNQMIKNSSISHENSMKSINEDKMNKKDVILNPNYKYCPTCGCAAKGHASKANLESARRSIEYRIREEAKITRTLFSLHNYTVDIQKIMTEQTINELPFNHAESFLDFDNKLKTDLVMMQKLKCFIILNVKSTLKLSESFSFIIPKIILPSIQVLFSAFGRESNGVKKLNFSGTETYKYLLEVVTMKFPDINEKEISSKISRWFSGAKDRDGGKRYRLLK
ncbi:uncharacterized protein LOC105845601 isoform X3 [Hydra vulgaris]|uniref:uncharacterized protein LOC105845601 isoform X3 n=1 Tax=Hydra vulgaris TaxID=6087 RepID=UPI001F5F6F2A|nr:uncharacterized protein LOC105845601 isoform X3 [Hydra vulgaris]